MKRKSNKLIIAVLIVTVLASLTVFGAGKNENNPFQMVVDRLTDVEAKLSSLIERMDELMGDESVEPSEPINNECEAWLYPISVEQILGKWNSVGFVGQVADFDPDVTRDDLYLEALLFDNEHVRMNPDSGGGSFRWFDNAIIHDGDRTVSRFLIKEIDDVEYMFFEWKSGDYTIRGEKPQYYVLKRDENYDGVGVIISAPIYFEGELYIEGIEGQSFVMIRSDDLVDSNYSNQTGDNVFFTNGKASYRAQRGNAMVSGHDYRIIAFLDVNINYTLDEGEYYSVIDQWTYDGENPILLDFDQWDIH